MESQNFQTQVQRKLQNVQTSQIKINVTTSVLVNKCILFGRDFEEKLKIF